MQFICALLAFCFLVTLTKATTVGELKIWFKKFTNPDGKGDNGHCCDGKWGFCQRNGCDHYFKICIDTASSSNNTNDCEYLTKISAVIKNHNENEFTDKIGDIENPLLVQFQDSVPESLSLKVDIWDDDSILRDDHVDFIRLSLYPVALKGSVLTFMAASRTKLLFDTEFKCSPDYYGGQCNVLCKAEGNIDRCDENGKAVCKNGWKGSNCAIADKKCDSGWKEWSESCYLFSNLDKTWADARSYCQSKGGDLLKIKSWSENTFIKGVLESTLGRGRGSVRYRLIWFGATDTAREGQWKWADGSTMLVSNWRFGEPNDDGGNEDCGTIYQRRGNSWMGRWNDVSCTNNRLNFICQKPL